MHPKSMGITPAEEDSISKARERLDAAYALHLEQLGKPWRVAKYRRLRKSGAGKRLMLKQGDAVPTLIASHAHRLLWLEVYINRGALDEQISDRVRYEARHFWAALEGAQTRLIALVKMTNELIERAKLIGVALSWLDVQKIVMCDAVPHRYKMKLTQVASMVKRALAA